MDAIRTATVTPAEMLGANDLGMIETGKVADIIAVSGDPLANLSELQNVKFVMREGVIYKNELR